MSEVTYSLVVNSQDKIAGTHNNATFNIEWDNFLPVDIKEYKVRYTFQSTAGYYNDGVFQTNPLVPTNGVATVATTTAVRSGTSVITFASAHASLIVGEYVYGVGISQGTTIVKVTGAVVNLSLPVFATISAATDLQIVTAASVNLIRFSSARVLANFGSKSYSYDTNVKGQSVNIGNIVRDTQSMSSRSNDFNSDYRQNCPRSIQRPASNVFTVAIKNNSVFQGGITAYTVDNTAASYGSSPTNWNFLCDTAYISQGAPVAGSLKGDMTPWTMVMEFTPIPQK
jgi:hypothetical protein